VFFSDFAYETNKDMLCITKHFTLNSNMPGMSGAHMHTPNLFPSGLLISSGV
jgi:hypothetical protein